MIKLKNEIHNDYITIKGMFEEKICNIESNKDIISEWGSITEFIEKKVAYLNLGRIEKYDFDVLTKYINNFIKTQKRSYNLDLSTLVTENLTEKEVISIIVKSYQFHNHKLYSLKTGKKCNKEKTLFLENVKEVEHFEFEMLLSDAVNYTRDLQIMPPNIQNSEKYATFLEEEFSKYNNIKVNVLKKEEIVKHKMGLLLSVNAGSAYEPRVVVLNYNGNPNSDKRTCIIGKGIVFDAGGMNIKTGKFMLGMKYDMSGSAIVAGVMKIIAQTKPKQNISAVLTITDNMVSGKSTTPDAVVTSMNGKTVEINNTDAEGRLAMADGLTYAIRELKATLLLDVATLTGAVLVALGNTYSGIWATHHCCWDKLSISAKKMHENIWRMPLHKDYAKFIKGSKIADLKNTDLSGLAGSCSAAMFLNEFNEGIKHIHFDVAGTADIKAEPTGVMVKTISDFVSHN